MKRPELRAVFASNGEGETVIIGYEDATPNKKEREAMETSIKLARQIGKEQAARRAPLKEKIKPYLIEDDTDVR